MEDATSEPILVIDDFVDVPDVGVEGGGSVNNVDRERSEIGTNDEREGVGVGEGDNIEREDVGVASKDDIEIGNEVKDDNVEREDVGVASEDDIKIGNIVGRSNGEDVSDFSETDEDITKLYPEDDFVDPKVSVVGARKASLDWFGQGSHANVDVEEPEQVGRGSNNDVLKSISEGNDSDNGGHGKRKGKEFSRR